MNDKKLDMGFMNNADNGRKLKIAEMKLRKEKKRREAIRKRISILMVIGGAINFVSMLCLAETARDNIIPYMISAISFAALVIAGVDLMGMGVFAEKKDKDDYKKLWV